LEWPPLPIMLEAENCTAVQVYVITCMAAFHACS